jgi:predicted RNase H-like HicB family nuclease
LDWRVVDRPREVRIGRLRDSARARNKEKRLPGGEDGTMKLTVRVVVSGKGGFMAACPSLPGCITWGNTREEARKKLDEAIRGYIAAVSNRVLDNVANEVIEV